jgi:SAM-dependent methyltransferase
MAHIEQFDFVFNVKNQNQQYFTNSKVLEIGSLDINGSVRGFFTDCEYLGIDIGPGEGVDLICEGQNFDGPNDYFDVVISCECFEHNPYWKETFKNMHRVCKTTGLIIMTCATTGRAEHGTKKNDPTSSPLTVGKNWDYYKNLEEKDFLTNFNIEEMFSYFKFSNNLNSHDLYFFGIKK